jgi:hypothetical protein
VKKLRIYRKKALPSLPEGKPRASRPDGLSPPLAGENTAAVEKSATGEGH